MKRVSEKYLATVPLEVWQAMLRLASDLDLDNDGLYDACSMTINIWVSPTDKPRDWLFKITHGALKYPREYLATINAYRLDDNYVRLTLSITNYTRKHVAQTLFYNGRIDYQRYKQMLKLAEHELDQGHLEDAGDVLAEIQRRHPDVRVRDRFSDLMGALNLIYEDLCELRKDLEAEANY